MALFGGRKPKTQEVFQLTPEGEEYLQHVREELGELGPDEVPRSVSLSPGMYEVVEVRVEEPERRKRFGLF